MNFLVPLWYLPGVYLMMSSFSISSCSFLSFSGIFGLPLFPCRLCGRNTVTERQPRLQKCSTVILIPMIENISALCCRLISPTFPWLRAILDPSKLYRLFEERKFAYSYQLRSGDSLDHLLLLLDTDCCIADSRGTSVCICRYHPRFSSLFEQIGSSARLKLGLCGDLPPQRGLSNLEYCLLESEDLEFRLAAH